MTLRELKRIMYKYTNTMVKIATKEVELEYIDHDWGKNEDEEQKKVDEWKLEKEELKVELEKYLKNVDLNSL